MTLEVVLVLQLVMGLELSLVKQWSGYSITMESRTLLLSHCHLVLHSLQTLLFS